MLISWRGSRQHPQFRPNLVNTFLFNLKRGHMIDRLTNTMKVMLYFLDMVFFLSTLLVSHLSVYGINIQIKCWATQHSLHLKKKALQNIYYKFMYIASKLASPSSLRIRLLNSLPSRHRKSSPGWRMPHLLAIARAVLMLSPVTIRTVIPARWHFLMASGTWGSKSTHNFKHAYCTLVN